MIIEENAIDQRLRLAFRYDSAAQFQCDVVGEQGIHNRRSAATEHAPGFEYGDIVADRAVGDGARSALIRTQYPLMSALECKADPDWHPNWHRTAWHGRVQVGSRETRTLLAAKKTGLKWTNRHAPARTSTLFKTGPFNRSGIHPSKRQGEAT